jgi:hypothetical protein
MDAIVELRSMLATHLDQTTDKLGLFKSNLAFVTFRGSRWQDARHRQLSDVWLMTVS